jgi:xanthine dehydrogenase YagR molybdenum-binding subunit
MATPYDWPAGAHSIIGTDIERLDGPDKAAGRARYTSDITTPGMLYARVVRSPYAHAKITRIDTGAAQKVPGFKAVWVVQPVGSEVQWAGADVVAVAAVDEHAAEMAARAVVVQYKELPHLVEDASADPPASFRKPMAPEVVGNPDQAFQAAAVTCEGDYGMPVITHCCLETHGTIAAWAANGLDVHTSTQSVAAIPAQFAQALKVPQSAVHAQAQYVGGAYGSKLAADPWGLAAAQLSKLAGGAPVKLTLERHAEQEVAGCRPSIHGHVKVGAKQDGTLTAWESTTWSTGGLGGGTEPPLPYLFKVPNQRRQHTQIVNNIGSARSMRAPHSPQACLLTLCAIDDLAAKLKMDPVKLIEANLPLLSARANVYQDELKVADQLMQWSARWKPRGTMSTGVLRQGLGVSMHAWPGVAHPFQCDLTINPDGTVAVKAATQDVGTGTRTVIAIVAAETLGLPVGAITVEIGDSAYPVSAGSGGSGTVGGGGAAVRRAAVDALAGLLAKVAPSLNTTPDQLAAAGGFIVARGGGAARLSWKEACGKLGALPLTVRGQNPGAGVLTDSGTGGVQMADVSVDTGTGVVKINKIVAVQDCGLVINRLATTSQVYGSLIMGIGYTLYEEKVMDANLGRMLNPNMEFYRLCGIGDIGELVVHLMSGPGYDSRGIIGCGEPAYISPGAAISNAVANAIGVRVPVLPLTPDKVLAALAQGSP